MKCPFCGHIETQVIETRIADDADSIRRRRQCVACEKRFTTYERAEINLPLIVKRDGRRVEYQRKKLFASMNLALRKRGIGVEQIDHAINRIEEALLAMGVKEVASETLGEIVMQRLFDLDKVAYIRFASVYKDFEDIEAFSKLAKELK